MLFGVGPTLDHLVRHLGRLSHKQRTLGSAICIQHHQRKHHPYQTFTHLLNTGLYALFLYFIERTCNTVVYLRILVDDWQVTVRRSCSRSVSNYEIYSQSHSSGRP